MGSPGWRPRSTAELLPNTVSGTRGAPQLYSHPTHWHARNLLRWMPVVRSIDPPGRRTSGHRPNLMIATNTHPHIFFVPIGNRELSRSFLRGGLLASPRYCDDKEGPYEGQEPRCPSAQIVRWAIQYVALISNSPQYLVWVCDIYSSLCPAPLIPSPFLPAHFLPFSMEFERNYGLPGIPMNLVFPSAQEHCSDDVRFFADVVSCSHGAYGFTPRFPDSQSS